MKDHEGIEDWMARRLVEAFGKEEEVMLEITVPMSATAREFRVGWTLKGVRSRKWIALSTGRAVWDRYELHTAAQHIESILACVHDLVAPPPREDRRS